MPLTVDSSQRHLARSRRRYRSHQTHMVIDPGAYDWEGDRPLRLPLPESIIYELHVGGYTRSPSAGCRNPGTFSRVMEKIPYLRALGMTAVELLWVNGLLLSPVTAIVQKPSPVTKASSERAPCPPWAIRASKTSDRTISRIFTQRNSTALSLDSKGARYPHAWFG